LPVDDDTWLVADDPSCPGRDDTEVARAELGFLAIVHRDDWLPPGDAVGLAAHCTQ
jgi:hypothetical protein